MENLKYFYEFKGLDEILNRVEILCKETVTPVEITGTDSPFILEYPKVEKLEAVQSSGVKLKLISERIFQFIDLHTDDMQGYMVKFYRDNKLYWIGYLDSELYEEDLSNFPPYPVSFSGSDFNILERLKFLDGSDNKFTDINTLLTQLKRCFNKLELPFQKLYIGCSTVAEDVALSVSETVLHKLYIQSSNFYDEDGEPMSCREVIESILEPFGLMMIQREANVYIYDYNTIKAGGVMKCYNFSTLSYIGDTAVNTVLGNLHTIGFASSDSTLGFEEMINNVKITSSPYIEASLYENSIKEDTLLGDPVSSEEKEYKKEVYTQCKDIECLNGADFIKYIKNDSDVTLIGGRLNYKYNPAQILPKFRIKTKEYILGTDKEYYLNVKAQIQVLTKTNPFDTSEISKVADSSRGIRLCCNLYLTDMTGKPIHYFDGNGLWNHCNKDGSFPQGKFSLFFCSSTLDETKLSPDNQTLDRWLTNSDQVITLFNDYMPLVGHLEKNYGKGVNLDVRSSGWPILVPDWGDFPLSDITFLNGIPVLEITNKCMIDNPIMFPTREPYPEGNVKAILINDFSLSIMDSNKDRISSTDCEFKSYVNKKVATDFKEKDLKVVSCNEEKVPVGKGNILVLCDGQYNGQLKFTRAGQTDILERLLMCSIHSNFTTKNRVISVDIKMTENPALRYVTYDGIIDSDGMIVKGCSMDFDRAMTRITAADFSADTVKLSNLPYDE